MDHTSTLDLDVPGLKVRIQIEGIREAEVFAITDHLRCELRRIHLARTPGQAVKPCGCKDKDGR